MGGDSVFADMTEELRLDVFGAKGDELCERVSWVQISTED
jgi:hypothetical protein